MHLSDTPSPTTCQSCKGHGMFQCDVLIAIMSWFVTCCVARSRHLIAFCKVFRVWGFRGTQKNNTNKGDQEVDMRPHFTWLRYKSSEF
eukprot:5118907-Amphidinium_carterae.2